MNSSEVRPKGKVIAVSGKGGVGKTLVATLMLRYLNELGERDVLMVDSDPDANLAESIGLDLEDSFSLGSTREHFSEIGVDRGDKSRNFEKMIYEIIYESDNFDFISMGRTEGEGCYCFVNDLVRRVIDRLARDYKFIIVDTEPGLEHFSRRTTEDVDVLFIITDTSAKGFHTARRILDLASDLEIIFNKIYLIINRADPGNKKEVAFLKKEAEDLGIEIGAIIPEDDAVSWYDLRGMPVYKYLPPDSKAVIAMGDAVRKIVD